MGNVGIYSVGTENVYQIGQFDKTECFVDISREDLTREDTHENQLSPFVMTLRIPVMCRAHASLHRKTSHEILAKTS